MPTVADYVAQLAQLAEQHPDEFAAAVREHPEWWNVVIEHEREQALIIQARADSAEGYEAFYELIHKIKPPRHIMRSIRSIYKAHTDGKGYTLNGFRGSWKSVSLSVTFQAYRIGTEPAKTNVTISANDDSAEKITKAIAQMIEFHPAWKKVFPHVIPIDGKWSAEGYWVWDNRETREKWASRQAGVIDPSFVGGGYMSTRINGKHPTGCLIVDDLHDINNSLSDTERKSVVNAMTTVILYTAVRKDDKLDTWFVNLGVPWWGGDSHQVLKKSGAFLYDDIPAMVRVPEGTDGAVYLDGVNTEAGVTYDDIVGWWVLTNAERFGVKSIMATRSLGKQDFWQMVMLDLDTARAGGLRYYVYPEESIDLTWPVQGGADPAFTLKERGEKVTSNSAFALGIVAKRPAGGAVLADGVLERCGLNAAAGHIAAAQSRFVNWIFTAMENVGMGLLFMQAVRLINPGLVIVGSDLGGIRQKGEKAGRAKGKKDRLQMELAPWLENATILISTKRNAYMDAVRDGLDNFSLLDEHSADERLDALDAFYHAVKAMPDVLQRQAVSEEMPGLFQKKKSVHPLHGMNNNRGYGVNR